MRNLVVGALVSLDGVMQAPGGPDEDPSGGFPFGGWNAPFDDAMDDAGILGQFSQPFDLLLGRRTYEIFAAYWPFQDDGVAGGIAGRFNAARKFVATRKGVDLAWSNSVALRDAVRDVARLKREPGPTLVTQGSTDLVHSLLAAGLVDELRLFTFPVVLGQGKRLFADGAQPRTFRLVDGRVSAGGIVAATYVRDGEVRTGTVGGVQAPSAAELERRKRWARDV